MVGTLTDYKLIARDIPRSVAQVRSDPAVARETEYYLAHIGDVKSADDLVSNRRLFEYAMKAHGLEDMIYAKAFMAKILDEGHDDPEAFVNKLTDKRYQDFAETFDFTRYGAATTSFTKTQQGVVDRYLRQTLELNAGNSNEAVRLALYFERKAPELNSVTEILADKALSRVVRAALGLPESLATTDLDHQIALIESRVDIADFTDPEKLSKFIERFTVMWDMANPSGVDNAVAGLLFGGTSSYGLSADLMLAIQKFK